MTNPSNARSLQARQHGSAAVGAGGVFLLDGETAGVAQHVELRISALLVGRDAGIADQTACGCGGLILSCSPNRCRVPHWAGMYIALSQ
jgi:hypothetical protein